MAKRCLLCIILLCLLAITITPAYSSTLPNAALFNWVEYKFASLFPKHLTTKTDLTHEGVHYDLRYWSGAWGTRYLGITDDGEIFGLGDYTEGVLKSFGYIDDWEEQIIADEDAVYSSNTLTATMVVSDRLDLPEEELNAMTKLAFTRHATKGLDGVNHLFYFPTNFFDEVPFDAVELIETSPDRYSFARRHPGVVMGAGRAQCAADEDRTDIKRFAAVDHGWEPTGMSSDDWKHGHTWVATDYGNGFEFEQISTIRGFYHSVDAYDIDNNGLDDILAVSMGTKDGGNSDRLHVFKQYSEGVYVQEDLFEEDIGSVGAIKFDDLNNDGDEEIIAGVYISHQMEDGNYWGDFGAIRIWKTNDYGDYEVVSTIERSGALLESRLAGIYRVVTLDFNKDGLKDIAVFLEVGYLDDSAEYEGLSAAFELYENHGNYEFTRVTETVLERNIFFQNELGSIDFEIVDVNNDGLDDIVLQVGGYGLDAAEFNHNTQQGYINVGSAIFLNVNGRRFKHLVDNTSLTIPINDDWNMPTWTGFKVLVSEDENNVSKLYGMNNNGAPITIRIEGQ